MDIEPTIGLEEEYFLVDLDSLDCIDRVPRGFRNALAARLKGRAGPEILESMIEVATGIHRDVPSALAELSGLREALVETAERFDLGVVAAGTHPFADWRAQRRVPRPRYEQVAASLGSLSNRLHICGLHVHVGVACPELRVDLMNRVQQLIPLMLGLSVSSPFWRGRPTGLAGYRTAAYGEIPRSGLPGWFASAYEVDELMRKLTGSDLVPDRSYVWWAVRPSVRYPTLELRAADSCPILEDVGAIAALYQSALAWLARHPREMMAWRGHYLHILEENRWQAARHGLDGRMADPVSGLGWSIADALELWVARLGPEAARLGCHAELWHGLSIRDRGTASAMLTRAHEDDIEAGVPEDEALRRMVETLRAWTRGGPTPATLPLASRQPRMVAH